MDIQQVKEERRKLATSISELVNSFQQRTELMVRTVDLSHLIADTSRFPVRTLVTVRIELGND
jgi:hypothetical protein